MKSISQQVTELLGAVSEEELKVAFEMATQDIKGNNLHFGIKTNAEQMVQITCRCVQVYRHCLE